MKNMRVVSKTDFAKLAKVGKSTVSNHIRRGKLPSVGGGIDLDDHGVQEYLAAKGIRVEDEPKPENRRRSRMRVAKPPLDVEDQDPEILEDKERLARRKLAEQIRDLELKNALKEGRLVSREIMVSGVWNPLETFLVRILSDGAKTIASTVRPMAMSGATREEIEVAVRAELTSFIIPLKESIQKALKIV
jgi:phage terminase Nu1 subunit (DNA packaging protein)